MGIAGSKLVLGWYIGKGHEEFFVRTPLCVVDPLHREATVLVNLMNPTPQNTIALCPICDKWQLEQWEKHHKAEKEQILRQDIQRCFNATQ